MSDQPSHTPPDLWQARDARIYVDALCRWKQVHERGFSFRKLARFAELSSPGYVQTFIDGQRNLKSQTAEKLAYALGLRDEEIEFFVILVQFTQADDPDGKTGHYEQLLRLSVKQGTGQVDAARLAYFTEWYIPVVHAMANLAGFRADPVWVGRHLVPSIPPQAAEKALATLVDLGLLEIDNGNVTVRERVVGNDPTFQSILLREYHRAMIRLSERALDLLPQDERMVGGFTVTVPRDQLDQVQHWSEELLRDLFYKILSLQEGREDIDGEVVQCSLQSFRLTEINS